MISFAALVFAVVAWVVGSLVWLANYAHVPTEDEKQQHFS